MKKRGSLNTQELIRRIEKVAREKMTQEGVVPLGSFRDLTTKKQKFTLLVVEDDETMRAALKRIFEGEGYRVKTAADGTELTDVLDNTQFDLIILDVGLPWVNGFELARLLKEHKELSTIPLVFVSAQNTPDDIRQGYDVGADDYITKPFDVDKIKKTVRKLLGFKDLE